MATRVMVIDPFLDHLDVLTNVFLNGGCNVMEFVSGKEAIAAFPKFQPHLLVSELFYKDWHRAWQIGQLICAGDPKLRPYMMVLTCQINDEAQVRKQFALCEENGFDELHIKETLTAKDLMLRVEKARHLALLNGSYV